jgi:hypothetical protein
MGSQNHAADKCQDSFLSRLELCGQGSQRDGSLFGDDHKRSAVVIVQESLPRSLPSRVAEISDVGSASLQRGPAGTRC